MVDNSIVVLESCFRAMDKMDGRGFVEYAKASLEGTGLVACPSSAPPDDLCRIYPSYNPKRNERSDVHTARLDHRILYECVPAFCDHGRSADLYAVISQRNGKKHRYPVL